MCLKICSPWAIPEETRRIGESLLEENDPYRLVGEQLFEKWNEEEFADYIRAKGSRGCRQ